MEGEENNKYWREHRDCIFIIELYTIAGKQRFLTPNEHFTMGVAALVIMSLPT